MSTNLKVVVGTPGTGKSYKLIRYIRGTTIRDQNLKQKSTKE